MSSIYDKYINEINISPVTTPRPRNIPKRYDDSTTTTEFPDSRSYYRFTVPITILYYFYIPELILISSVILPHYISLFAPPSKKSWKTL